MSHIQVQKTRPMNSSELTELLKRRVQAGQSKPAVKVQAASEVTERIRKQAAQTLAINKTNGKYNFYNGNSAENVTEVVAGRSYAASTRYAQVKTGSVSCCEPLPNIPVQRDVLCEHPLPGSTNAVRCYIPAGVPASKINTACNRGLLPSTIQK
jgi:hypothetical protein